MGKWKPDFKLFKDILQQRNKYSQGRVYLFISILAYYTTIAILTIKGSAKDTDIDLNSFKIIVDALQWSMALFAGYVFGGKGLDVLKIIFNKDKDKSGEK
jgi:hypothetical protein